MTTTRSILRRKPLSDIEDEAGSSGLFKTLGLWQLTAIGVGGIIGVGIFTLAGEVAHGSDGSPGVGPAVMVSFLIAGLASAPETGKRITITHARQAVGLRRII